MASLRSVTAKSVIGFSRPDSEQAHGPMKLNGGCAQGAFGRAGFLF